MRRPWLLLLVLPAFLACSSRERCNPEDRDACGAEARCVVEESGDAFCEPYAACDPASPTACPGGYVCRPVSSGRAVCEPTQTAGRIPACIDSAGLDVFAVEANSALSITWNVNGSQDTSGGFEVAYGTTTGTYAATKRVGTDARELILAPLPNGTPHFVVVRTLGGAGNPTFTSCEVAATPHVLVFSADRLVTAQAASAQARAALASNLDGSTLFLAWEEGGRVALAHSADFGDSWASVPFTPGTTQSAPALVVREAVRTTPTDGGAPTEVRPETLFAAWAEGGSVRVARHLRNGTVEPAVTVGAGSAPALALGPDRVHVVYASAGAILHAVSTDEGATFSAPVKVSGATVDAAAPSLAVHPLSGDVAVAWHAREGGGDSNVYFAASQDEGGTFGAVSRIDDDRQGLNQLNVSIAVNPRTHEYYATWEDRRGGANVFFALSADGGSTWSTNLDVGAGLGGDQFRPRAVVDVASNVYVTFQDTTNGARVVFTRFNAQGSFDPPLQPSSQAGKGGVVGDRPAVATDRYGTVYLAWEENRGGPSTRILFSRAE